jgi:homocitrate synthase NifV
MRRGAGYDLRRLREACHDLAGWVDRPVPDDAPVIGDAIFACESGIHLDGLLKDPALYEPFPPEIVGARRSWRLGRTAGRGAVRGLLGVDVDARGVAQVRLDAECRGRAGVGR